VHINSTHRKVKTQELYRFPTTDKKQRENVSEFIYIRQERLAMKSGDKVKPFYSKAIQ
jgi:hypothetical protein